MEQNKVYIGTVPVGDSYPTAFMAEIGTFYNKNIDKAIFLIDQAVKAGVDIIKTEILHDSDIILKSAELTHTYAHASGKSNENYRKLIERKTVSLNNYKKIIDYVKNEKKIPFTASCYDFKGIDFLVQNHGDAIKLWKNNYNNPAIIRYAAKTGLPLIFDAADVYFDEVAKIVRTARQNNAKGIIINHHPGKNPASPDIHNLRIIRRYKKALNIPVGLSCHYRGDEILYAAVGAGVNLIEKGVFDNPDEDDQNIVSTARLSELKTIVRKVKNCWKALGKTEISVPEPRDTYTLLYGIVSRRKILKGEKISRENIKFAFPAAGISVEHWDIIKGRKVKQDISSKNPITWEDVDFEKK